MPHPSAAWPGLRRPGRSSRRVLWKSRRERSGSRPTTPSRPASWSPPTRGWSASTWPPTCELEEGVGPGVLLDKDGAAALAAAGADMATAEKAERAAHRRLNATIDRLE